MHDADPFPPIVGNIVPINPAVFATMRPEDTKPEPFVRPGMREVTTYEVRTAGDWLHSPEYKAHIAAMGVPPGIMEQAKGHTATEVAMMRQAEEYRRGQR